jgi:hypothetical protein
VAGGALNADGAARMRVSRTVKKLKRQKNGELSVPA